MSIAIDAVSSKQAAVAASDSLAHTCTGSNLVLIAGITVDRSVTISSFQYNGVNMTLIDSQNDGTHFQFLYRLVAPATGTHNISVTLSAAARWSMFGLSLTGVDQTTPLGTSKKATFTGNNNETWLGFDVDEDQLLVALCNLAGSGTPGESAGEFSTVRAAQTNNGSSERGVLVTAPGKKHTAIGVITTTQIIGNIVGVPVLPVGGATGAGSSPLPTVQGTPTAAASADAAGSLTFSVTVPSGLTDAKLVVAAANRAGGGSETITGITYGGVALTQLITHLLTGGPRLDLWVLDSPAAGTANVVITASNANNVLLGAAVVVDTASTWRDSDSAGASATRVATPLISSADTDLMIGAQYEFGTGAQAMGEGQTSQVDVVESAGSPSRLYLVTQPGNGNGVVMSGQLQSAMSLVVVGASLQGATPPVRSLVLPRRFPPALLVR